MTKLAKIFYTNFFVEDKETEKRGGICAIWI